jgi:hypothetical protein
MPLSRYKKAPILSLGSQYGTSSAVVTIRRAVSNGIISVDEIFIKESERLDILAGKIYDDARYWWILAAASDIGWGLQVPPGTIIKIPSLQDVISLIG